MAVSEHAESSQKCRGIFLFCGSLKAICADAENCQSGVDKTWRKKAENRMHWIWVKSVSISSCLQTVSHNSKSYLCSLRWFEFIKRRVWLLLQIWKSRLFNERKLLLWCASVTEPDVCLSVNHISAENVRLFPVWGIKVSSSGMFWFISLSAEGNGAFYAVLIRKRQSRKTGKPLWKKNMLGSLVLHVCVFV